jgi:hypothetical protein
MKNNKLFIFIMVLVIVSLACNGTGAPDAVPTSVNTATLANTATSLPRPTSTPRPTATQIPPTATPAQVGDVVADDLYEITIIHTRKLNTVYLDAIYQWVPNPGYLFLEAGVKVKNLNPDSAASVRWSDIYVTDENGDSWFPGWAGYKAVASGVNANPKEIIFAELNDTTAAEEIVFEEDVYLRLIWTLEDNNPSTVLFGFDTSPLTKIVID